MPNDTALLRHPEKACRPDTPLLRMTEWLMHEAVLAAYNRTLQF